jgi:phosphatidylserine/phosphatidylglycerophosphate/cardiolipin synthase-like enzyme
MKALLVFLALFICSATGGLARATPLVAQGTVEVLFTPWDDVEGAIVQALGDARKTIHLQVYLITSRPIANALFSAVARGVKVELLADREMAIKGANSQVSELASRGVLVWLETRYAAAHNKIILIDALTAKPVVITGSYNYTWSAQARNAENLLLLSGDANLTKRYLGNWQRHRSEAQAWTDEDVK